MTNRRTDLAKAAAVFRDAFTYDPGHSDLDNEQPITIRVTLGDWRKLDYALAMLDATTCSPTVNKDDRG
jgi:hypothetical protein